MKVLMCGVDESMKGGILTVANYLKMELSKYEDITVEYIPTVVKGNKMKKTYIFFKRLKEIKRKLKKGEFQLVHLHVSYRGSFYRKAMLVKVCNKVGIPVILHHHGSEFYKFFYKLSSVKKSYVIDIIELASLNIVLSEKAKDNLAQIAPKANITHLYNSVHLDEKNNYNVFGKKILFLGNMGERKGIYDLLTCIKSIEKFLKKNGIKFLLCGDGDIEKVRNTINQLEIQDIIEYLGWANKEMLEKFYKDIIINILPSYNEALPMTILETMAKGIPNISTYVASIPEIIEDGVNGYLINPGDIHLLSERIKKLCKDGILRKKLSENSYATIKEKFIMSKNIDRLIDIYYEVIKKNEIYK